VIVAAVLALIPIMMKMLFSFFPLLEARIMPVSLYPLIQSEFWLPFAVLFFACAGHLVPARNRRAVLIAVAVMVVVVVQQTSWHLGRPDIYAYEGKMVDGVCHQTSPETCGAASMVTLLNTMGVQTTEGEMARLSMTAPRKGLSPHQAAYGLKTKLGRQGRPAHIAVMAPDLKDLRNLPGPFLVGIKFSSLENHMICVLQTTCSALVVGDPLSFGRKYWTWEEFEKKWSGVVIVSRPSEDRTGS
jgi:predicted double-glycine peptidase